MNENKTSLKDRIVSKIKNDSAEEALQKGGLALGTLYGMKSHNMGLAKALTTTGLVGAGVGTMTGSTVVPAMRLKKMHEKELGTDPDKKDYAKVVAANAIPAAGAYGLMAKNRDSLEGEANKAINFGKNLGKGKIDAGGAVDKIKDIGKKMNPQVIKSALKNANPKKLAVGAGVLAGAAAMELPNLLVSPESIINKKKEGANMDKSALEVIESAYEKIAGQEYDEKTKKKLKENRTTFWHDRAYSNLKDGLGGVAGAAVGAGLAGIAHKNVMKGATIGGAVGTVGNGARRLKNIHNEELGTNPNASDYAKNIGTRLLSGTGKAGPVGLLGTPEAIVKAKQRQEIKDNAIKKSALEIIEEAYEKIASIE